MSPGWGKGKPEGGVYWTRARIVKALRKYAAENDTLPTGHKAYSLMKKGRLDLPTASAVLALWGSFGQAWLAVGVPRKAQPLTNARWSKAEITFLLEHAGSLRLEDIAKRLNRSYAAVRTKLGAKGMGIKARENAGFMSAKRVAAEYGIAYYPLIDALKAGSIPAEFSTRLNRWLIDPADAERYFGKRRTA